jgi:hypothetical protein
MIDLLIKYPSRSRPELFKNILNQYIDNLSGKQKVKFIITMDCDDDTCNNNPMRYFLENCKSKVDLEYHFGNSKSKIEACNANIPTQGWKTLLLISDDMKIKVKNYDDIICNDMIVHFPDYDGCLNYNAHKAAFTQHIPGRGSLMVLSIMGNAYYNRLGYIYNPIYKSLFADDEQTRIARKLNKIIDIDKQIINHDWNSIKDDLRIKCESLDTVDRQIFKERLQKGLI